MRPCELAALRALAGASCRPSWQGIGSRWRLSMFRAGRDGCRQRRIAARMLPPLAAPGTQASKKISSAPALPTWHEGLSASVKRSRAPWATRRTTASRRAQSSDIPAERWPGSPAGVIAKTLPHCSNAPANKGEGRAQPPAHDRATARLAQADATHRRRSGPLAAGACVGRAAGARHEDLGRADRANPAARAPVGDDSGNGPSRRAPR
jgi:hypothetical protein